MNLALIKTPDGKLYVTITNQTLREVSKDACVEGEVLAAFVRPSQIKDQNERDAWNVLSNMFMHNVEHHGSLGSAMESMMTLLIEAHIKSQKG